MNIKIIYNSETGNTKKVAEAIAEAIGEKAESMDNVNNLENVDLLFIGSAVYATYNHDINPKVEEFINKINPNAIKNVVVFCTGFSTVANTRMKELLEKKNINILKESFMCKGKLFKVFNYGHPNIEDLENAKLFAKNIIKNIN